MIAHLQLVVLLIKIVIVVLLIGVVLSLFSGLVFLFKDSDRQDSKRTLYALGVRITLAAALLLTVFYGLYTGQLEMGSKAPWHERVHRGEPSATDKEPSATDKEPSATDKEPSATDKEPSAPNKEPSAPNKEPSAADQEPL